MMLVRRTTQYTLTSPHSTMTMHVRLVSKGAGYVSGWISRDWRRLRLIDAYLATLPNQLWERGDKRRFTYAFGERALSRRVALDIDAIMMADLRRKRGARKARKG